MERRDNVKEGLNVITEKWNQTIRIYNDIQRYYLANKKDKWKPVPEFIAIRDVNGIDHDVLTMYACTLQAYNGAQPYQAMTGTDSNGITSTKHFCMWLNEDEQKWYYISNQNIYVHDVLSEE